MMEVRRSEQRGITKKDWLESYHSFPFNGYYDPQYVQFGPVIVLNDVKVVPGGGFPNHSHRDMEFLSYILAGELEHKDSIGGQGVIKEGTIQLMTAGNGIRHSEYNPSPHNVAHFLQIWILPFRKGLQPAYEQKSFAAGLRTNLWCLVASGQTKSGAVQLHQDVNVSVSCLESGRLVQKVLQPGRQYYLYAISGAVTIDGISLSAGDAVKFVSLKRPEMLAIEGGETADLLLLDVLAS